MQQPRRNVSRERQATFYIGGAIAIFGFLLFLSVFITGAMHFGDFTNFEQRASSEGLRAIFGIVFIIVGAVASNIGARGLAGSGAMLDPQKAREDLEPFNRAAGGMINDALQEVDTLKGLTDAKEVVKIRCPHCKALNDETAQFCNQCGQKM